MSGKRFRELRDSIGYSQERLANELHVTNRSISRWENGAIAIPKVAELALHQVVDKHKRRARGK